MLLKPQDSLLSKVNQKLPFTRHVISPFQHLYLVQNTIILLFVWTEEIVINNPKRNIVVGTIEIVVATAYPVRGFEGTIQTFDHLFERSELSGYLIVVGKSDHLGDMEFKVLFELKEKLLGWQWIGAVTVSNEAEIFRELLEMTEGHSHGKDARSNAPVIRYLVTENRTGYGIHDEPDITFYAPYFDIGLIGNEGRRFRIVVVIHKRLDKKGCGSGIVSNLLMRDFDPIQVIESLSSLAQRKLEIHVHSKAQGHDVGIVLGKLKGRGILGQGVQVHTEEVYGKFPVDIVELVLVLPIFFFNMLLIDLFKVS